MELYFIFFGAFFWGHYSIKYEEIYLNDYKSMSELKHSISKYMKKYNNRRLHSSIGNKTPDEVYYETFNNLNYEEDPVQLAC